MLADRLESRISAGCVRQQAKVGAGLMPSILLDRNTFVVDLELDPFRFGLLTIKDAKRFSRESARRFP
ncbi:hypothetical protein NKJ90_01460 [Mesorhizobium sp. M0051]|uniref:hypothetical protein n=1 Tax=unclassified Mesorhizobium TaxID=325217 RepID=UPI0003CF6192|nr:hypothetical protein [Mesorhizobium sp. LNHC252B00]ESY71279.1 hypothetical protein X743_21965 [Mesorhizobium sp. LNHC252B00]